jgi:hypothetical protein
MRKKLNMLQAVHTVGKAVASGVILHTNSNVTMPGFNGRCLQ